MLIHPLFLCHTIATPTVVQHQQRRIIKFLKSTSPLPTQKPRTEKKTTMERDVVVDKTTKRQHDGRRSRRSEMETSEGNERGKKVVKTFRSLLHFRVLLRRWHTGGIDQLTTTTMSILHKFSFMLYTSPSSLSSTSPPSKLLDTHECHVDDIKISL